jgi:hypothetical protein
VRVEQERRSAGAIEKVDLVLERQVVEEPEAEHEVEPDEVELADVPMDELDLGERRETLGPRVDGDDRPSRGCRTGGELAVPRAEVDAASSGYEGDELVEKRQPAAVSFFVSHRRNLGVRPDVGLWCCPPGYGSEQPGERSPPPAGKDRP